MKFANGLEALGTDEYLETGSLYHGVVQESSVERVELPATLKRIEYSAFENCKNLKNINLPEKLEYIGTCCFQESALEAVSLPALKVVE